MSVVSIVILIAWGVAHEASVSILLIEIVDFLQFVQCVECHL